MSASSGKRWWQAERKRNWEEKLPFCHSKKRWGNGIRQDDPYFMITPKWRWMLNGKKWKPTADTLLLQPSDTKPHPGQRDINGNHGQGFGGLLCFSYGKNRYYFCHLSTLLLVWRPFFQPVACVVFVRRIWVFYWLPLFDLDSKLQLPFWVSSLISVMISKEK